MNLVLFDASEIRKNLLPFTFTRPVAEIRVGIMTIAEKWKHFTQGRVSYITQDYLEKKFPLETASTNIIVNAGICPTEDLVQKIRLLKAGQALVQNDIFVAGKCSEELLFLAKSNSDVFLNQFHCISYSSSLNILQHVWDIFSLNAEEIKRDFAAITKGRTSEPIHDKHTIIYGMENVFIEEGAEIKAAILNAETGPIYIGKHTQVLEGAIIRGAFALCEGATVSMGAKIRGDTTIGPYSKMGGEVSNSVVFGYSNKAHDGFLGNSVIGEWCNIGADSNVSNLKNNYALVKIWNYLHNEFVNTGKQFCGLMMGDHTRCGINTMFNTGTVTGVGANIFGGNFKPKFIPSFSWSQDNAFSSYDFDKFMETAIIALQRRNKVMDDTEKDILRHIFESTVKYRNW